MTEPTPDLQQAIHAATKALEAFVAENSGTYADGARIAVEAAWPYLQAKLRIEAHALIRDQDITLQAAQADLQQAIQGKIGVDKDQNQLLVDVPGTAHVIADALGQLQAAQAENQQLRNALKAARPAVLRDVGYLDNIALQGTETLRADAQRVLGLVDAALEQQAAPGQVPVSNVRWEGD